MKKKVIPFVVAAALAAPGLASAAEVTGFADIFYTIADDSADTGTGAAATNTANGKFSADGEVDFSAKPADGVTVRVDVDVRLGAASSSTDTTISDSDTIGGSTPPDQTVTDTDTTGASIEQAYFAWGATDSITVLGGVFNNPIGHEAEDAPDMDFATHGLVYQALDSQSVLPGDNVAGLAAAIAAGPATITVALLNDLHHADEVNSFALVANMSPMKGLDLELGMVTQAGNTVLDSTIKGGSASSVGNATNFNLVYSAVPNLTIGLDYLTGAEVLASASDFWLGYQISEKLGVKYRSSSLAYNSADVDKAVAVVGGAALGAALDAVGLPGVDTTKSSIYLSYQVASNLSAALEVSSTTPDGGDAVNYTALELIATF